MAEDAEHRQHVLFSALMRFDRLISRPLLTSKFDSANAWPQDLNDAAAELPLLEVEQDCIKAILRQLACDAVDTPPVPGVATLNAAMVTLQQRLTALKDAVDCHDRASPAPHANATAASEVFSSTHLLGNIMSYAAPGDFLFVATVSRRVGAVAIAQVASVHGAGAVCTTKIYAALGSASRLALALESTGFADLVQLRDGHETADCLCERLGELESMQAVESMQVAGIHVCSDVLVGAATKCNIGYLHSLWCGPLGKPQLCRDICYAICAQTSGFGDDGAVLSWVAPQLPIAESWPPYFFYMLCNAAALSGHIGTLKFLLLRGRPLFSDQRLPTLDDASMWANHKGALMCTVADGTDHVLSLVDAALRDKNVRVLRWLHARQPPLQFTDITMTVAALLGGLPTMKWLRAHGCPHDINEVARTLLLSCGGAATPPKMEWVRSCSGGDWSVQGMSDMLVQALAHSSPALACWLRAEGARWPSTLAEVVMTKPVALRTLLWAVQQGCPFGL